MVCRKGLKPSYIKNGGCLSRVEDQAAADSLAFQRGNPGIRGNGQVEGFLVGLQLLGLPMSTKSFEEYRSEEWLPAAFAVTGISTLLLSGTARWVAVNLLGAVLALYFIHGLAIIRAHLARWIGRGWFVRWGLVFLCLPLPIPVLVSTLGLADSFFELRPQVNETGGNHEGHS